MPPRHVASSSRLLIVALLVTLLGATSAASALDFRIDYRSSTYQATAGDSFSDLLAQHESEALIQSNITLGLDDVANNVYGGGARRDYSMLMQTTLEVGVAGEYTFQVGTDWGRGGAAALVDDHTGEIVSELVLVGNLWWSYDWEDADVFTTTFDFEAGDAYTLTWVGFEGCCGGSTSVRFSVDGGAYQPLTSSNMEGYLAPEPGPALLLLLGLAGLASTRSHAGD